MKNTLRLWVGVLAIGFRFFFFPFLYFWRREKRIDYGNQKFRDAMMSLTLWGGGFVAGSGEIFWLVCGFLMLAFGKRVAW